MWLGALGNKLESILDVYKFDVHGREKDEKELFYTNLLNKFFSFPTILFQRLSYQDNDGIFKIK